MLPLLILLACGEAPAPTGDTATPPATSPSTVGTTTTPAPAPTTTPTSPPSTTDTAPPLVDPVMRGPFATVQEDGSTETSCNMVWTRHAPEGRVDPPLVLLAHGFARARRHHADLADHLASWGFEVVRPDLCHASLIGTDHPQNGLDLVDLADALADGREVWFVGHSAGGLASALAATASPRAAGHLGLDMVDASKLGEDALATTTLPVAALLGMPEPCNSQGNAVAAYATRPDAPVLRVPGADHCDFESPTDSLCTAFCANGSGPEPATYDGIRGLATAWLLWQSGEDPAAASWWTGDAGAGLVQAGIVEVVQ